ncbi:GTP-binding protein [Schaalia vaccimaxillae]|uniref:GTP-binding protein n=1 Tax=Schaalia vaccimaxillae TaxID=183916 RepID=UPI0003B31A17|nr:GTP-binding protein [Schaalia vaccimaxillae]
MKLCALTSGSALLRSAALMACADLSPILTVDIDDEGVSMRLTNGWETLQDSRVPLAHSCITCSLREGILPLIAELSADGLQTLILALPVGVEALNALPSICDACEEHHALNDVTLSSNLHLADADTAASDLFEHVPLNEAGIDLFEGDERCTGELLMNGVGYADLVCVLGENQLGLDLIEHLRPLDTLMVHHFDELTEDLLFAGRHDPDEAIARIHPASTRAWGGPEAEGVWTLDLHSDRPFHPERLANDAAMLAPQGVCARGCFWIPSRPTMVGTWEVSGGGASVGSAGEWVGNAFTHLVVTGTGPQSDKQMILDAFEYLLMTEEEMTQALQWVGVDDGMTSWFEG